MSVEIEANRKEFEYRGYPCIMWRSVHYTHWCGYIGLQPGHPWYGKQFWDIPIKGLSYSRECAGPICHTSKEKEHLWWIGFQSVYRDTFHVNLELRILVDLAIREANK